MNKHKNIYWKCVEALEKYTLSGDTIGISAFVILIFILVVF